MLFRFCLILCCSILLASCGSPNPAIDKLKEVHLAIQAAETIDELYPYFTDSSVEYFKYMTQIEEQSIEQKLLKGYSFDLMFTTALFAQQGDNSQDSTLAKFNETFLLHSFKMSNNPVFSWSEIPQINDDLSSCCNPSYVTVLKKLDHKTYITKKIYFEGPADDLKLDVLSALRAEESLFKQSFAQFREPGLLETNTQKSMRRLASIAARAHPNDPKCTDYVKAMLSGEFEGGGVIYRM